MLKKFLICKEGILDIQFHLKNFFLNKIVNIFTFTSSIIPITTITLAYCYTKQEKWKPKQQQKKMILNVEL